MRIIKVVMTCDFMYNIGPINRTFIPCLTCPLALTRSGWGESYKIPGDCRQADYCRLLRSKSATMFDVQDVLHEMRTEPPSVTA